MSKEMLISITRRKETKAKELLLVKVATSRLKLSKLKKKRRTR